MKNLEGEKCTEGSIIQAQGLVNYEKISMTALKEILSPIA